jgi:hypothetical protein
VLFPFDDIAFQSLSDSRIRLRFANVALKPSKTLQRPELNFEFQGTHG